MIKEDELPPDMAIGAALLTIMLLAPVIKLPFVRVSVPPTVASVPLRETPPVLLTVKFANTFEVVPPIIWIDEPLKTTVPLPFRKVALLLVQFPEMSVYVPAVKVVPASKVALPSKERVAGEIKLPLVKVRLFACMVLMVPPTVSVLDDLLMPRL